MNCDVDPDRFGRIIRWHLRRFPRMETRDLVKMAYQAALGNQHLAADPEDIRSRMETELASRRKGPCSIYLIEPLSPHTNAGWIRVNLDAWHQSGGETGQLADVVAASTERRQAGNSEFLVLLHELEFFLKREAVCFRGESIGYWIKQFEETNFAPIHHSTTYVKAYRPAYRVVYFPLISRYLPLRNTAMDANPGGQR
ncbi:MAG: hypothetical protein JXA62_09190 [Candidatus Aminicenantes bacterium]|nr:hypothetical protein [Candidatus Aminicenantes bacterium]